MVSATRSFVDNTHVMELPIANLYIPESVVGTAVVPSSVVAAAVVPPTVVRCRNIRKYKYRGKIQLTTILRYIYLIIVRDNHT